MSGLTAFLQAELLSLSNEAKRKHPDIKEAAERLSAILRSFKERPGHDIAKELNKTEDALQPFLLACETKNVKLCTIAIGCMQRLISFRAIPETSVRVILKTLNDVITHGVDIQLKILQTVLPLLTNYQSVHDEVLAEALLICFRLQDSKTAVVNNTAAATLRQLVIFTFDKVAQEDLTTDNAKPETVEMSSSTGDISTIQLLPCAKDAYFLFQDLCRLTNGERPAYLKLSHLSKTFGLELIESVLTNHFKLFRKHTELVFLLKDRVCPLAIKNLSEKQEFPQMMRVTRVVYILIKQFHEILVMECEVFLSMFIKILESDNSLWQRVLSMEVFRGVCSDAQLLRSIYRWYDRQENSTDVFKDMITAFNRLATENPQAVGATATYGHSGRDSSEHGSRTGNVAVSGAGGEGREPGLSVVGSTMKIQCIDQLDKTEPPQIPETYIFYLSLICLGSISDGLAAFVLPIFQQSTSKQTSASSAVLVSPSSFDSASTSTEPNTIQKDISLVTDMANIAWPGLLASMSFFLLAHLDEELFQGVMRAFQNFTNVCGVLKLEYPRDAFLTILCKSAVPSIPSLSLSSTEKPGSSMNVALTSDNAPGALTEKNLYCLRVLLNISMFLSGVLGPSWYLILETLQHADLPLTKMSRRTSGAPTSRRQNTTPGSSTSSLSLPSSASNFGESDHVSTILASFKRLFDNSKLLDDTAYISFTKALCALSAEATGVTFEDTETNATKLVTRSRPPDTKSFAIEKLRYIAILNMPRLIGPSSTPIAWDLTMTHLIKTANFSTTPPVIRTQVCEAIADIIDTSANYSLTQHLESDKNTQIQLLVALDQCINVSTILATGDPLIRSYAEVQRTGLETLNKLLMNAGHSFTFGWSMIFDMIKSVCTAVPTGTEDNMGAEAITEDNDSPVTPVIAISVSGKPTGLVRTAFPCLQLICTDFLSLLSPNCLRQCIETLTAFGSQMEDLNISLTAIGLLWNVSDFIQTKRQELENGSNLAREEQDITSNVTTEEEVVEIIGEELTPRSMNALWVLLLMQLSTICSDVRPEVRNGANQTLFRTIDMNGAALKTHTWHTCLWQVLFPLIDSIKSTSIMAIKAMQQTNGAKSPASLSTKDSSGFMVHHSRNTVDKQWDETKVLLLTGMSAIIRDFLPKLLNLEDFDDAWVLLLAHLEDFCLYSSQEVAIASVRSLKSVIVHEDNELADSSFNRLLSLYKVVWTTWERIGLGIVDRMSESEYQQTRSSLAVAFASTTLISSEFSQDTLTAYVNTFTDLYRIIKSVFSIADVHRLLIVLKDVLVYATSPQYRPDTDHLSPLQEAVLEVIGILRMDVSGTPSAVISELADYMTLAFVSFGDGKVPLNGNSSETKPILPNQRKYSTVTYIALTKMCMRMTAELFDRYADDSLLYTDGVFEKIIGAYGIPMKLKYECPQSYKHNEDIALWKIATKSFLDIIKIGLAAMDRLHDNISDERFEGVWRVLVHVFQEYLLSPSQPPTILSTEELNADEHFDISMLDAIQADVLPHIGHRRVPKEIISQLVSIIQLSSRLYVIDDDERSRRPAFTNGTIEYDDKGRENQGTTGTVVSVNRENYAYSSLRTLFAMCSDEKDDSSGVRHRIAQVAAPVLLERCEYALRNYTADQRLLGRSPFPRIRNEEILFILKQLIEMKMRPDLLDVSVCEDNFVKKALATGPRAHIFQLYSPLCNAITCGDPAVVGLLSECFKIAGTEITCTLR